MDGDIEENPSGELDVNGNFATFVIAGTERDAIGHSSKAAEVTTLIANHIHQHSRIWTSANRTKQVKLLELSKRDNPLG